MGVLTLQNIVQRSFKTGYLALLRVF